MAASNEKKLAQYKQLENTIFELYIKELDSYLEIIQRTCHAETFDRTTFGGTDNTYTPKLGSLKEEKNTGF